MPILNRRLLTSTALTNVSLISAGMLLLASPAMANPQGGQVIGGQATIVQSAPNTLTINQSSSSAAINWNSFSIGKNETTDFNQPSANSIAFNRVTGVNPSDIEGHLNANGQVVLVNPNGILFSKSANVNVGGLVASTSNISQKNAIAGNLVFDGGSNAGATIVNNGRITAKQSGLVALVAPSVINNGIITAKLGKVALAAGDKWTLDLYGDNLVSFALNDKVVGEVKNTGRISANGGTIQVTADVAKDVVNNAINMGGVVEADSVSSQGGTIILAAAGGNVAVTGKLSAQGTTGGTIEVTGNKVALTGATVNASGTNGGGTIDIGGAHGGGTLAHAQSVTVDTATKLIANAQTTGNGGSITVWSDGVTNFAGSASAKGGSVSGNGGTVETSGETLGFSAAKVDTSAAHGTTGTWLLDPYNLTIDAAGAQALETALGTTPSTGTTNVVVQTTSSGATGGFGSVTSGEGDIDVQSNVLWNSNNSLTLSAYDNINVDAVVRDAGNGNIVLRADNTGDGTGSVSVPVGSGAVETGGVVSIYYDPTGGYTAPATYVSSSVGGNVGGGNGAFTAYMLVNNVADLKKVSDNLAGDYALGQNISGVGSINPIGNGATPFTGIFDGNGGLGANYTIAGVSVTGGTYVGLFGDNAGTIRNVTLVSPTAYGDEYVASLVGYNLGTLVNDGATNVKISSSPYSQSVGGLIGYNGLTGFVSGGSVTGNVTVGALTTDGGGFVGSNFGTIVGGDFAGTVVAGCVNIGGFVGQNYATGLISGASASAYVENGGIGSAIGGFAGLNDGRLFNDTATQATAWAWGNANSDIGGFVGENALSGTITGGFVSGAVTATSGNLNIGGFAGYNAGVINSSTSDVPLLIGDNVTDVGGFAGYNSGAISDNNFTVYPIVAGTGSTNVGGYVGFQAGGTLSGVSIAGGYVSAGSQSQNIGGLVGYNAGTMENDSYAGTVTADGNSISVGGAIGLNFGTVEAVNVSGLVLIGNNTGFAGGVIGANYGGVSNSSFDGTVTAGCYDIGGFVGGNFGTITNSFATGDVSNAYYEGTLGGFAGENAIGTVNGTVYTGYMKDVAAIDSNVSVGFYDADIGGLVGFNSGTIVGAFDSGSVYAGVQTTNVGGFVGYNIGAISSAGATDSLHALSFSANVGGFAGNNGGTVTTAVGNGSVLDDGASQNVGGFIGYNSGVVNGGAIGQSAVNSVAAAISSGVGTGSYYGSVGSTGPSVADTNPSSFTVNGIGGGSSNVGGYIGDNVGATISGVTVTGEYKVADGSQNVGGLIGKNSGTLSNDKAVGNLTVGSAITAVGGLVGYNTGLVSGNTASGNLVAGNAGFYIGGGVGWNDAGGTVTGMTVSGNITAGSNVSGVGGIVGLNGSDTTDSRGNFAAANASVSSSSFDGNVSVGGNSFAVAGLVGWNSQWTDTKGTVRDGVIADASLSGQGTVSSSAGDGTTFIHNANQDGCDERAAGNCFGVAGLETITITAADLTMTYNGSAPNTNNQVTYTYTVPAETRTVNGLESGDQTSQVVEETTSETNPNAGTYTVTVNGQINPNNPNALLDYALVVAPTQGTVTINKAALTITPTGSQTYGGTNVQVSYGYQGLVAGQQGSAVVTGLTYATNATPTSPVAGNPYTITASNGSAANYSITYDTGVFTVNKAPLTITPTGSQTYGGTNVQVSYGYQGLVAGQQGSAVVTGLTYATNATPTSPVAGNPYTITASNGSAANYSISYDTGAFTVNKANLTVTPNGTQTYGGTNVQVSYNYQGMVNGEQGSAVVTGLTYATTATPTSPVAGNPYVITASNGSAANYNIGYDPGVFTVSKADVTVTPSGSQQAGGGNTTVTYSITGLVNNDPSGVITGLSYTTTATPASGPGNYFITALGGTASNYDVIDETGPYVVLGGDGTLNPPGTTGTLTAISQGSINALNAAERAQYVNVTNEEANQVTCLKVNAEVRGVTTDSPIDCSSPLQVNGF